jgi:hypothetical protein
MEDIQIRLQCLSMAADYWKIAVQFGQESRSIVQIAQEFEDYARKCISRNPPVTLDKPNAETA